MVILLFNIKVASKLGMQIVSQDWILECGNQEKILKTENYKIPFLTDVHIGILGFAQKMTQNIKDLIHKQGGNYVEGLEVIKSNVENLDLILTSEDAIR